MIYQTNKAMNYTAKQIENAKVNYQSMLQYRTVESYEPQYIGWAAASQRCDYHNKIVDAILGGNTEVIREWKTFFLNQEAKKDQKEAESKAKILANIADSADILAPIKAAKKITAFGQWLNTTGNPYRSQHFSKRYTKDAVNSFLNQ